MSIDDLYQFDVEITVPIGTKSADVRADFKVLTNSITFNFDDPLPSGNSIMQVFAISRTPLNLLQLVSETFVFQHIDKVLSALFKETGKSPTRTNSIDSGEHSSRVVVSFQNKHEAMLFKLTYGGEA